MTHVHDPASDLTDPAEFWEARYITNRKDNGRVWSGLVNAAVERAVAPLTPGTALELGSGEGADALWLASQGWTVTAVDISAAALAVGAARADHEGTADRIDWVRADLATWHPLAQYDLVTAAFLHSPVELPREEILRRASTAVAPHGRLLVVGHTAFPHTAFPHASDAGSHHDSAEDAPPLPTSDEVLASLELPDGWIVETNALFERAVTLANESTVTLHDTVLLVRRDR